MIYPLFIFKADDGTFDGYFPDIEGCMFAGNNLESALRDAESAFGQHGSFD
jgi:predicted RNase H-like HicB family nuclease